MQFRRMAAQKNGSEQVEARMSCLTNPLQHFFDRIMSDALEEHDGKVSIV